MSGGYFDYAYLHLIPFKGNMEDEEMNELMEDLINLLYELEWYKSGDTGIEDYKKSLNDFKNKWIRNNSRDNRFLNYINTYLENLKEQY